MSKKTLFFSLILLASLTVVVSGCVAKTPVQPVPNNNQNTNAATSTADLPSEALAQEGIDTSNWKTYRNEEYGFEVKYPNNWILTVRGEEANLADGFFISKGKSRIGILPNGEFDYGLPFEPPKIFDVLIDSKKAKLLQWNLQNDSKLIFYQFIDPILEWIGCDEDLGNPCNRIDILATNANDLKTLQKIISTFSFIQ